MTVSLQGWKALLVFSIILPPAGLVLLWMHPGMGVLRKAALSPVIGLVMVAHLWYFFGLQVERDGGLARSIVKFHKPETHYARLEQSRSEVAAKVAPPLTKRTNAELGVEWADYRGRGRAGVYRQTPIFTEWPSQGLERLWKQPSGGGYASFSIAKGTAFTIEQRRAQEVVAAYDIETGRELWTHGWNVEFKETLGGDGPRATPVWYEGRVYALGAEGELRCLDAETGKRLWSRSIREGVSNLPWGMAAAPLIVDDKVVVSTPDRLAVYHRMTGAPVWESAERRMAYVSPMLATLAGRRQIVHVSALHALGISLEDGTLLWDHAWGARRDIKCAQPLLLGGDRVYFSGGYGQGALVLEIAHDGTAFTTRTVWENTRMKNKFSSAVLHEGHIYGMDEAILACIDAKTGDLKWKGGRYGYGQLVLAGSHLIVLTETGDVVLVKATPAAHQELARFSAIDGKTWNNPALSDGLLLVRNTTEMAGFRIFKR